MARKPPSIPAISMKTVRETIGYRELTKKELAARGLSTKSRQYVPISKRDGTEVISRRQAISRTAQRLGFRATTGERRDRGVNLETLRDARRAARGGRTPQSTSQAIIDVMTHDLGLTRAQARKRTTELKRELRKVQRREMPRNFRKAETKALFLEREKMRTLRRLEILSELYPEDRKQWLAFVEMYH